MGIGESWGRFPKTKAHIRSVSWRTDVQRLAADSTYLAYGQGRSYGDCCLNDGGTLLRTAGLNRLLSFDREKGILRAEAGITFDELLRVIVPAGWFLPVTPGTRFVSLGGAIANDVHGKNHHRGGTFGRFVRSFELLRSDGKTVVCSPTVNAELFAATIAGLGLTGLILTAEIQLKAIVNAGILMDSIRFHNLSEFFEISRSTESKYEYTVAWLDCVASGDKLGRGIFMGGNHHPERGRIFKPSGLTLKAPFDAPGFLLNRYTVQAFNQVYFHKQFADKVCSEVHYAPFFYPLDSVLEWNRIYGSRGFFQFQCVVPSTEPKGIQMLLERIVASGKGSFLAVLKEFGDLASPGMLSFPRKGVTLCLDFANQGESTILLMGELENMVTELGGALYPAKDALMSAEHFTQYYPRLPEFKKHIDPQFSSSLWRRVTTEAKG
jgi:FAD/FMN-containing dehydrogenase